MHFWSFFNHSSSLFKLFIVQYLALFDPGSVVCCLFDNIVLRWFSLKIFRWLFSSDPLSFISSLFSLSICCFITAFEFSMHLSSQKLRANCVLDEWGKLTIIKFNKFVTVSGLWAGNTRVSLRLGDEDLLFDEFFEAGKNKIVGTDKAVNSQGKSFSAASIVTKLIFVFT